MSEDVQVKTKLNMTTEQLANLTRRQLKELEEKKKTPAQKVLEAIIMNLPLVCFAIALLE